MTIDEMISKLKMELEEQKDTVAYLETQEEHAYYIEPHRQSITACEQLAEWLEELKALREYKSKIEMQYLDDMNNPLEPLKLKCALEFEIFKYNYRKEHKPQEINTLDYTVMYALKHCLDEQLKAGGVE